MDDTSSLTLDPSLSPSRVNPELELSNKSPDNQRDISHTNTPLDSSVPTEAIQQVDLNTIFTRIQSQEFFADPTFEISEAAKSIKSFVRIDNGNLEMSNSFRKALDVLAHVSDERGAMYKSVVSDLQRLQNGAPPDELRALQLFIHYQVYKVGEHDRTHDEQKWTKEIAADVMEKVPQVRELYNEIIGAPVEALVNAIQRSDEQAIKRITGSDKEIDEATLRKAKDRNGEEFERLRKVTEAKAATFLLDAIEREVEKHYMCRMRYTQPIPSFVDKGTPGFIKERLRIKATEQSIFLFETSNGVTIAYDNKKYSQLEARAQFLDSIPYGVKIEFTPFDAEKSMIATMQVPVMSEPVTLHLSLEDYPELSVTIGKHPEEMGYQMTNEPAGVFRRSLNSQRVTEIQGLDDQNRLVAFQMKGAGVPAYGFDMANAGNADMGTFTGSEFFKLNAEMGSIGLRSFATSAFDIDRIAPQTLGMALVADKDHASSSGQRNGAISFRADYSLGVRLENVLSTTATPDDAVTAMRDKVGLKTEDMAARQKEMLNTMARNLAITHLFGMQYDDSSMKDLADVGLAGEFSDSGTLRNLDPNEPAPVGNTTFVSQGVRNMLGAKANEEFPNLYAEEMVRLLNILADKTKNDDGLRRLIQRLTRDITDPAYRLLFLQELAASLGGSPASPTPIQQAFYTEGIQGYVNKLDETLQEKLNDLDQFKAECFLAGLSQAHEAYKRLGFASIKELEDALNPILERLSANAILSINTIGREMRAILPDGSEELLELENVLRDAEALTNADGQDTETINSVHRRIDSLMAKMKAKMEPAQYKALSTELSEVEAKRVAVTAKLAQAKVGVREIRTALEAENRPRDKGKDLYNTATNKTKFEKAIEGLSRAEALSAIDVEINKRRTKAGENEIELRSVERRYQTVRDLINKYLPE